ncbi:hypothetical protein PHYBOEH_008914 [Phytophthora boehmeriae]|uniref:Uncharacterized protein n=1 Tax=Phytophthora boehmeriae TaxID=109152 RepID=A0A8T1X7A3_9STRA|nr:hypothetical protein PHYBOEH_008914 [Phytophthora boehmeriae]
MLTSAALSSAIALLAFASRTDAHGHLKSPEPTFEEGASTGEWVTLVDNYWDIGSGGDQVGKFKTMAAEKGMSVKDVVLDMVKDKTCGYTLADADPKPVPSDGKAIWRGSGGDGFTHTGPCEIYIDDKMVLHGDDCEEEYPGGADGSNQMSEMPVDYSSCNGNCMLTIYWLGFQNEQWQSYINCVPLTGSGGGGGSPAQTSNSTSSGETPTTESSSTGQTQTESTDAPASESSPSADNGSPSTDNGSPPADSGSPSADNESPATPAPLQAESPATEAPSTATQAPSAETPTTETDTKCTPARRRLGKQTTAL